MLLAANLIFLFGDLRYIANDLANATGSFMLLTRNLMLLTRNIKVFKRKYYNVITSCYLIENLIALNLCYIAKRTLKFNCMIHVVN